MRISDWSSDVCSSDLGGDSGGSYISGTGQAQGVLSGGSGNCKGDKNTTFGTTSIDSRAKPDNPGGGNGNGGGGGGSKPSKATPFFTPVNTILPAYNQSILTGNWYRASTPYDRTRPVLPGRFLSGVRYPVRTAVGKGQGGI